MEQLAAGRAEAKAYRELDRGRVLVLHRRGDRDVPVIEDRLTVVCDALAPAAQSSSSRGGAAAGKDRVTTYPLQPPERASTARRGP